MARSFGGDTEEKLDTRGLEREGERDHEAGRKHAGAVGGTGQRRDRAETEDANRDGAAALGAYKAR